MSYPTETTHAAGGLEGLNLGAPLGAGSTDLNAGGLVPSSGSHLTSHSHSHPTTGTGYSSGAQTGSGLSGSGTGSNVDSSKYSQAGSAINTTSGDRGIGGGRGGPTAFEADASRVGDRSTGHSHSHNDNVDQYGEGHRTGVGAAASNALGSSHTGPTTTSALGHEGHHHHHHGDSGLTGSSTNRNLVDTDAGIRAGMGAGHHDQHSGSRSSGLGAGGLAAGGLAGAGAAAAAGAHHHHHNVGTEADDSVTGQQHFSGSGSDVHGGLGATRAAGLTGDGPNYTGGHVEYGNTSSTTGTGSGARTGLMTGAGAGAGLGAGAAMGASSHGQGHHGVGQELKEELKGNQGSAGYDQSEHHTETSGPHGLVWHNGKYVHKRELDGRGSTGVPLK